MAYNKYTWKNGDVIDEIRLNSIENGIAALDTENENSLKLTSQTLTESQKQAARTNIGAANAANEITHLKDGSTAHSLCATKAKAEDANYTMGSSAFAIGESTQASGVASVAQGQRSIASGGASHAEGVDTEASFTAAHAEGRETIASGQASHAEGYLSYATESYSHAEGKEAYATAVISHAQGEGTIANHRAQTALGAFNIEDPAQVGNPNWTDPKEREAAQRGTYIEIVGNGTDDDHRSNARTLDWNGNEVLSGKLTIGANAEYSNEVPTYGQVQGMIPDNYISYATQSLTDQQKSQARTNIGAANIENEITNLKNGNANHSLRTTGSAAENSSYSIGAFSVTFGDGTKANSSRSIAEGFSSIASGGRCHAEGDQTTASGLGSHSEGGRTLASGEDSHAEGNQTTASGLYAHAEGRETIASGDKSHAEGEGSIASGDLSHAEGSYTIAKNKYQHVFGKFNIEDPSIYGQYSAGKYIEIVGNGNNIDNRSNARTLDWNGNEILAGKLTVGANAEFDNDVPNLSQVQTLISAIVQIQNLVDGTSVGSLRSINSDPLIGTYATAFGPNAKASGSGSFAAGAGPQATGGASHAEGNSSQAIGGSSHAEGINTIARSTASHAEGNYSQAIGANSHAEGNNNIANGIASHAEGIGNVSVDDGSHAGGKYGLAGNFAEVIGNGTDSNNRSNARTLDWNGNEILAGKLTVGARATLDNDVPTLAQIRELIPNPPTTDGTYALKVVVVNGEATYQWILE